MRKYIVLNSNGFDLWANGYDQAVGLSDEKQAYPFAGYKDMMNALYGGVMARCPASVLDIGLGTGTLATKLYEAGNTITGIDFSPQMLSLAKAKMPQARLIQHDFTKGLPETLAGETFDFIISTYAMHHLTDPEKVAFFPTLLSHLNQKGVLFIGDIAFQTRAQLEACKATAGDAWDGDECYPVYDELSASLAGVCQMAFHPFSHCAGVLGFRNCITVLHTNQSPPAPAG